MACNNVQKNYVKFHEQSINNIKECFSKWKQAQHFMTIENATARLGMKGSFCKLQLRERLLRIRVHQL